MVRPTYVFCDYAQGKISGKLYVKEAVPKRTYSFLDYVMGGTRLNCTIAIDFTGKLAF